MRGFRIAYAAVGVAAVALAAVVGPNPDLASLPWAVACLAATTAIAVGARSYGMRGARFWIFVAAAIGSWGLAAVAYFAVGLSASSTTYQLTDLLYLPGYLGLAAAAASLAHRIGSLRRAGLDAAIGTVAVSGFLWSLVLEPRFEGPTGVIDVLAGLYPICDVVLLMIILRLLFSTSARLVSARILAVAVAILVASDAAYLSPFVSGSLGARILSPAYTLAYLLFGAAALHPSMRRVPFGGKDEDVAPRRLLAVIVGAPLTMPIALAVNRLVLGHGDVGALALVATALIVLVSIRVRSVVDDADLLRRRAEESEQKFRMVFDSAAIGISFGRDGLMSEPNLALQELLGYSADELAPLHYTEITHPDDRLLALEATDEVMAGDRRAHTFEKRLVRKDGSVIWVAVTLSRAGDGSFGISLISDITARKQLEQDLLQAQKMEAVGKLAGGIAHDFNNVMTAVSASADLLALEIDRNDPRRRRVDVIAESAARATELTRKLLAFSRRQVLRLEPVDLADVVVGMRGMLERLLPPNIEVAYSLAGGAFARVDRPQLEQVLLNLALNARDALPGGGRVSVSVRAAGDSAELIVADNGVGMDETVRRRIFEPFFTTKQSGTGLGLSTVDGIVGQSGGTLAVESEPRRGSVFTIRLPLVAEPVVEPAPAAAAPAAETAPAEAAPGRLLLADDEDLVRRVTSEMLRRLGYDVVCAASGEEALDLLDDNFDALVTDVAMTGMNGRVLADRVHERTPGLPVLFVSGYPAEVLTGEHMVAEGSEVLTKPFTSAELADRIELIRSLAPLR